MEDKRYSELLSKMNTILRGGGCVPPVSPALGGGHSVPSIILEKNMSVESLSKDELIYAHTLAHKIHATGSKTISKEDVKIVHSKIIEKMNNHVKFDKLDE